MTLRRHHRHQPGADLPEHVRFRLDERRVALALGVHGATVRAHDRGGAAKVARDVERYTYGLAQREIVRRELREGETVGRNVGDDAIEVGHGAVIT